MTELRVIGVDPGPVPGIVLLDFSEPALLQREAFQCTHGAAARLLEWLLYETNETRLIGVEQFVVRGRASRSSHPRAGAVTRDLIGQLQRVAYGVAPLHLRSAGEVKPWATDERLDAAGLLAPTSGMRHARDAARHALFTAVKDGGIPDPLSKEWSY